jgi:hypothetical protein
MIKVIKYERKHSEIWNDFLSDSKNGTFLFDRNYIEYHSSRFKDHSLIVMRDDKPICLFPANEKQKQINSHEGLTYGGIIIGDEVGIFDIFTVFYHILKYYYELGFTEINYKSIPAFFHRKSAFEDQYAIFLLDGKLVRVDTFFSTKISSKYILQDRRGKGIKKAIKEHVKIVKTDEFKDFWSGILAPNLKKRFGVKPVHSLEEIMLLKRRFPKNVLQFNAMINNKIVAGTTIYLNNKTAHAQYISANDLGRKSGAIDLLFYDLLTNEFKDFDWFSFGITNENQGKEINIGLTQWKEGFGANVFPQYFYKLNPANYLKLEKYIKI